MRNTVVDGQFQHLRIDHDHPALLRRHAVEQRQDHRVQRDRFARTGRARDQQDAASSRDRPSPARRRWSCRAPASAARATFRIRAPRTFRADRRFRASGWAVRCRSRCGRGSRRRAPRPRSSSARCRRTARPRARISRRRRARVRRASPPGRAAPRRCGPRTPKSLSTASRSRAFSSSARRRMWAPSFGRRLFEQAQRRQLIFALGEIERGLKPAS